MPTCCALRSVCMSACTVPHDRRWHEGRRFFACRCGARDETRGGGTPTLCWSCFAPDPVEWVPPAVARDRAMNTQRELF